MQAETRTNEACGVCGTPSQPGARFCKACGASLRPPPTCPACSTAVPEEARFCPGCGLRLVGARSSSHEALGSDGSSESQVVLEDSLSTSPDSVEAAKAELQAATRALPKRSQSSGVLGNVLMFFAGLAVILVVIRQMNLGAPKEVSPFEAPPPSSMVSGAERPASGGSSEASPQAFSGTVELGSDLSSGLAPAGTLFIIARIQGTPDRGPPIAVKRIANPSFPVHFSLGPGDVMQAGLPFDGPFDVRARLDTDGNAMTKTPGDLFTSTATAATPGAKGLRVLLDMRIE